MTVTLPESVVTRPGGVARARTGAPARAAGCLGVLTADPEAERRGERLPGLHPLAAGIAHDRDVVFTGPRPGRFRRAVRAW